MEETISFYAIPVILGILALLIRAPGLGKWCITIDEFYYSQPVAFILEKGVPELPGGGYYTRGILLQYLTALPVLVFKKWEFAIRFLPLLFGSLTIPLFYILCKYFLPTPSSLFASLIILLSSWHIEFSRFARFYAPFQFLFLLFLLLFYKGYWQNNRKYQILSWLIAFLSIFVYEGSIFLPPLMLLGSLVDQPGINLKKRNLELLLVSSLLLCCNYLTKYDWGFLQVNNTLPSFIVSSSIVSSGSNYPIELPRMDLLVYTLSHWESIMFYFMLIFSAAVIYFTQIKMTHSILLNITILIAFVLPLIHLYVLSIFLLSILILSRSDVKKYFQEHKALWIAYYMLTLLYWVIIIYISGNMDKIMHFIAGYPPIKKTIIVPLYENVPFWGYFILFPFALSVLLNVFRNSNPKISFLLIILLTLFLVMPVMKTLWYTTRYVFFFYPLFVIIIYSEVQSLIEWINRRKYQKIITGFIYASVFLPFLIFLSSEDFHLYHVLNVSSKETNFRMGSYEKLSNHWYARVDLETPVNYVNNLFIDGDIVVLDDVIMSRYIDVPYVNYVDVQDGIRFPYHSRNEGRTEMWSGRPLIYNHESFEHLVPKNEKNSLWLVSALVGGFIGTSFVQESNTPREIAKNYNLHVDLKYVGVDNRIGVWQFKNKKNKS